MNTEASHPLSSGQEVTPLDLVHISETYQPTMAFTGEIAIEPFADNTDPCILHVSSKKQVDHVHSSEKEALEHWAE